MLANLVLVHKVPDNAVPLQFYQVLKHQLLGERNVALRNIEKIAKGLKVSLAELMDGV